MGNAEMYQQGGMDKNNNSNLGQSGMLVYQSGMMNSEMGSNGTIHGCRMEVIDNSIIYELSYHLQYFLLSSPSFSTVRGNSILKSLYKPSNARLSFATPT